MQAPRRSLRQGVRSPATCRFLVLLKTKLTWIPSLLSYPHLTRFVARLFAGRPRFRLRGSVGLAVGLAIKWPAALPSSAAGLSCRRLSYYGSGPLESDYRESNYCRSTHCESTHRGLSYQRCNVNKRQGRFGGKKNDRLMISKKPPNPVGTEEENQGRKDLVVVQSSKINVCDQWCIELFAKSGLHLEDLIRLCSVKPSLLATTFFPHGEFS